MPAPLLAKHALWRQLAAEGVTVVYGNPGTFEQGMLDALRIEGTPRYVMGLQEASVLAMATNDARLGRRCSVVQLHAGVGLGNAMGALQEALRGEVPMLILCGENTLDWEVFDGYLAFDLLELARPVTKWAARVPSGRQLLRVLRRAWQRANTPPRGPVLLALPMDVLDQPVEDSPAHTPLPCIATQPDPHVVQALAQKLSQAASPVILIGDALAWSGGQDELVELAGQLGAPVYGVGLTMAGRLLGTPAFMGFLSHTSGELVAAVTQMADVVLCIGVSLGTEIFPKADGDYLRPGSYLIQLDPNGAELGKNITPDLAVQSDPRTTLAAISAVLGTHGTHPKPFPPRPALPLSSAEDSAQLSPRRLMQLLVEELPTESIVLDEAMTATQYLRGALLGRGDVEYLACLSRGLGSAWPAAVPAKLQHPDRTVVAISADGAALYVSTAPWTAAHLGLHVIYVVVNNQSYQILKYNIRDYWNRLGEPARVFPFMDLDTPGVRFDLLGESMGLRGWRAHDEASFRAAFRAALSEPRGHVIDVHVQREI